MHQNNATNKPGDDPRNPPEPAQDRGRRWSRPIMNQGMESKGPVHHVFVDFENIQAIDLDSIGE
jgi:hypothetical protein